MSVTLEQLQQVEYDILKRFDEYCTKHSLEYVLTAGTLLGAVRHNGIIPWDDDIDVSMDYKSFQRFIKLLKKDPIDSCFFSWYTTEIRYPLHFAKLRKDNTYMPADYFDGLDLHNGIWLDIFITFNKPTSPAVIKLQEKLLGLFQMIGEKYYYRNQLKSGKSTDGFSRIYKLFDKCPDFILSAIRRLILFICAHLAPDDSERVRLYDLNYATSANFPRSAVTNTVRHKFFDSEVLIPADYDTILRLIYGDNYMTPYVRPSHVRLEKVRIDTEK